MNMNAGHPSRRQKSDNRPLYSGFRTRTKASLDYLRLTITLWVDEAEKLGKKLFGDKSLSGRHIWTKTFYELDATGDKGEPSVYWELLREVIERQNPGKAQRLVLQELEWAMAHLKGGASVQRIDSSITAQDADQPIDLSMAARMHDEWLFEPKTPASQQEEFAHLFKNLLERWISNQNRLQAEYPLAEAVAIKAERLMSEAHARLPKTGERHLQLAAAKDDLGWILKQQIIQDRVKATSDGAHTWEHCYTLFQSAYTQLELASAYTPKPLGLDQKRFDVLWNWIHGELTWGDTVKTHVPVAKARRDFGSDSPFLKRLETDYWVGSAFLST